MPRPSLALTASALGLCLALPLAAVAQERFGLGEEATAEQIAGWDIDARPPGVGLPEGSGSVAEGREVYDNQCVACHGPEGEGPMARLAGGINTLATDEPAKTVGSYWPYATTLFDYIHRAMPFDQPQSLSTDELYAVTAYVLYLNDLVPEDAVLDPESLPEVEMPNRDGFYGPDPRPDTANVRCMRDCEPLTPDLGEEEPLSPEQVQ